MRWEKKGTGEMLEEYLGRRSPQGAMLPSTPGAWLRVTSQSKPPLPTHFLQEELLRVGKGSKGPCGHPRLPITAMPTAGTAAACLQRAAGRALSNALVHGKRSPARGERGNRGPDGILRRSELTAVFSLGKA